MELTLREIRDISRWCMWKKKRQHIFFEYNEPKSLHEKSVVASLCKQKCYCYYYYYYNFFASFSLTTKLLQKEKTLLLGAIRSNKKALQEFKRTIWDTFQCIVFTSHISTFTMYESKPNKKVVLLNFIGRSRDYEQFLRCLMAICR